jgi:drug/metabolite transporter (DMT)-like permease
MAGMNLLYPAIILTAVSTILYHLVQKSTPSEVNPMISLLISYLVAAVVCLALFPFFSKGETLSEQLHKVNWASFALGAAVLGIEAGYLLAYRSGGNLSTTNLMSSSLVVIALLIIGYFAYHDQITAGKIVGIIFCTIGIIMINK